MSKDAQNKTKAGLMGFMKNFMQSCSFEAASLRAQFRHVRHKRGAGQITIHDEDDDKVMQLWIRVQGSNAEKDQQPWASAEFIAAKRLRFLTWMLGLP